MTQDQTTQDQITRETEIAAPLERVWSLLTEAEHLGRWFGDAGAEVDLRPGGAMAVHWSNGHTIHAVIEAVEPTDRFAWRWLQRSTGDVEYGVGNSTLVEFTLSSIASGTLLTVVESGFASLTGTVTPVAELFASHTGGWKDETDALAEYAAKVAV